MGNEAFIKNPIIPGFYPDPSVCRDGDDYYLVTSSFEFYPGVPLFHSRDLVNWQQHAYCLDRPSQLPLQNAGVSDGIYAPTLRKHNKSFYMITSNRSHPLNHFFVTTRDIQGCWSDPIWISDPNGLPISGVDPSLFFDHDGKAYFSCVAWDANGQGIGQAEIDLDNGRLKAPLRIVWHGTGGTFPEGPHTYRINGYYYLMIAEGGTEYGHKVTISRSENIWGPYVTCPHNPILTQTYQYAQSCGIQGVGHGDLFEAHDGTWWLIVHGFRPSIGKLHHLGRETLLAPVTWDRDGWPVVNGRGWLDDTVLLGGCFKGSRQTMKYDLFDSFTNSALPLYWNYIRNPVQNNYTLLNEGALGLSGSPATLNTTSESPTWIGRRQQHFKCTVQTEIDFNPQSEDEESGLTVYQTNEHHYDLAIARRNGKRVALLRKTVGDIEIELNPIPLESGRILLKIEAYKEKYLFSIRTGIREFSLGSARTQLISTEAMQYQNFTGTYFAMYAVSPHTKPSKTAFYYFSYYPGDTDGE